jgi:hypothetical protein
VLTGLGFVTKPVFGLLEMCVEWPFCFDIVHVQWYQKMLCWASSSDVKVEVNC